MKKYVYLLAMSLCLGLVACGDDGDDNVVSPGTKNIISQLLPDPEGTVTARITNDGIPDNGIKLDNGIYPYDNSKTFVYMDKVNNLCVKGSEKTSYIMNLGRVAGLAAITKVPEEGFSDKVATSEGDGFIIRGDGFISFDFENYNPIYGVHTLCRMYLASYIRDALGNIIGATIKYQTGNDWVKKNEK